MKKEKTEQVNFRIQISLKKRLQKENNMTYAITEILKKHYNMRTQTTQIIGGDNCGYDDVELADK